MPPEINCGSYVKAAMIGRTLYCATSGVLLLALARRQRRKEMTDFLAQMPTGTYAPICLNVQPKPSLGATPNFAPGLSFCLDAEGG
jgi:hypothetical protein